jgi:hypothetical protein
MSHFYINGWLSTQRHRRSKMIIFSFGFRRSGHMVAWLEFARSLSPNVGHA